MREHEIYLDSAATTHPDPEVILTMERCLREGLGNASSIHKPGTRAAREVEKARSILASRLNASPEEIFFTSGGTEANNFALKGLAFASPARDKHLIISAVEHPSVREVARWLRCFGFELTVLPVDSEGFVRPDELRRHLRKDTFLVSIMHANNEVGTVEPIDELGAICRAEGITFHTDACQSFTKIDLDVQRMACDLVTINGHKVHGPAGVGALYIRKGLELEPFFHGGSQEGGKRSGTYNVAGIAGFGKAAEVAKSSHVAQMTQLRDHGISRLLNEVDGCKLNGPAHARLCNNINFSVDGVGGKHLFNSLNKKGIFVSMGSACSSNSLSPSKILLALGYSEARAHEAIRLSLSRWTTAEELDLAIDAVVEIVSETRKAS